MDRELGADIRNAGCVVSAWERLDVGDTIRLTPDPYFGRPGQFMTVDEIQPETSVGAPPDVIGRRSEAGRYS